ncbi:L,D-transpeptidase family protein [Simiduia agarivorans]|uniref:L,D-TPase catalytic domain-containing protein n=1 Tax=Simiduia agarivorans (strain DSM 21679 / JCM 13881 / BCRC 17597 / SA1) TaxID=1117647 RepID=K4KXV6_SIMAS|nr:L,D-transpeptidase family protein [Simiduia agarivorans]AFU98741.1 hypothetical protein M5M_07750 [Simiduia agarivorans SA1 = DSM 21679]
MNLKTLFGTFVLMILCSGAPAMATEHAIPVASQQMVLVLAESENSQTAMLYTFYRDQAHWQSHSGPVPVTLGRTGLAWGIGLHPAQIGVQKREGDGKAPAGVFYLGDAFGAGSELVTGLHYQPMTKEHYCVDVPASPLYNQTLIKTDANAELIDGSTEPMRRDLHLKDSQYNKGIFVGHNPHNQAGAGSCIFMHIWRAADKPTAGCTALDESAIDQLLAWLKADQSPVLVQLTRADYQRLRADWALPLVTVP